jgi:hypothetical protein
MDDQNQRNKNQKPRNRWIVLTGAGIQMGVVIFVCAYIGKKLDANFETETAWFTLGFILFGIFASLYLLLKQIKDLED